MSQGKECLKIDHSLVTFKLYASVRDYIARGTWVRVRVGSGRWGGGGVNVGVL